MLTIATLLRSGGEYNARHVERLRKQCEQHIPHERFVCLSDVNVPCHQIRLAHDWPRWWGQCELFRPDLFDGPVLYMDLDTTVLRDPQIVIEFGEFWSLGWPRNGVMTPTSGVMAWWGGFSHIYEATKKTDRNPLRWVNDGIFPHIKPKIIQDRFPGFYSYKRDVRDKGVPADARVIFFHGKPRPWQVPELTL